MELLKTGLDSLYVAYQGAIPATVRAHLRAAKNRAKATGVPEPVNLNGIRGTVGENGSKGGYAFLFSTGDHLETWKFKDSGDVEQWNLFVEVRAANCAGRGFEGVVGRLSHVLRCLDASIITESVNRIDFAADFIAPGFQPDLDGLICHSHTGVAEHYDKAEAEADIPAVRRRGRKIETVTVGQQPGRQVTVYNKRKEVIFGRKAHWLALWGYEDFGGLPEIWRVEVRAGKRHLSDWNISTFDDVRARIADLIDTALEKVRFAVPSADQTVTRWRDCELWSAAREAFREMDFEMSGAAPGRVVEAVRSEYREQMKKQAVGVMGAFAFAADGDVKAIAEAVAKAVCPDDETGPLWVRKRMQEACGRAARRLFWMEDENGSIAGAAS